MMWEKDSKMLGYNPDTSGANRRENLNIWCGSGSCRRGVGDNDALGALGDRNHPHFSAACVCDVLVRERAGL